ncbi:MAG: hypothetical protein Q9203_006445 [Teloschistes exilis]
MSCHITPVSASTNNYDHWQIKDLEEKERVSNPGEKEVTQEIGKVAVDSPDPMQGLHVAAQLHRINDPYYQISPGSSGPWLHSPSQSHSPPRWKGRLLRKPWILWICLVSIIVIGGTVGGFIGGSRSRKNTFATMAPTNTTTKSSSSSIPAQSPTSTSADPQVSSSSSLRSSLASVAWKASDPSEHRRLYYNSNGTIKEAAWNSSGSTWYTRHKALGNATASSFVAAAVAGTTNIQFQLNIYYLTANNEIVELYTKDDEIWQSGEFTDEVATSLPGLSPAVTWTLTDSAACNNCGTQDMLVIYQQDDGRIKATNRTAAGLDVQTIDANATLGPMAIQQVWRDQGSPDLRLFYRNDAGNLCFTDFESQYNGWAQGDTAGKWISHEESPIGPMPQGAQVAAFSWGRNITTGDPAVERILFSGLGGIRVAWQAGSGDSLSWQSESPDVMKNIQAYSGLAANADRHVYAWEAGVVKEFSLSMDGTSWHLVGDVPTEN